MLQHHNCGGPAAPTLSGCTFAEDYAAMIKLVRTLGTSAKGPKIYVRPAAGSLFDFLTSLKA